MRRLHPGAFSEDLRLASFFQELFSEVGRATTKVSMFLFSWERFPAWVERGDHFCQVHQKGSGTIMGMRTLRTASPELFLPMMVSESAQGPHMCLLRTALF